MEKLGKEFEKQIQYDLVVHNSVEGDAIVLGNEYEVYAVLDVDSAKQLIKILSQWIKEQDVKN